MDGETDPVSKVLTAAGISVCRVSPSGEFRFDAALAGKLGLPPACRVSQAVRRINREHRREIIGFARMVAHLPQQRSTEFRYVAPCGGSFWFRAVARRFDEPGIGDAAIVTLVDITEERAALDALRESEQHLRYTVEFNPQLPWIADPSGKIIDVTDRWLRATGMSRENALGDGWLSVTHPEDRERVGGEIAESISTGKPFDVRARLCAGGEYRWMRAHGYPRRDETGQITRWYGYTEDIHEQALVEERIRWTAEHDPLTGLTNRTLFNTGLEKALATALPRLRRVGVLLIDLDHFKEVNDLMGHHTGDELLVGYARQLKSAVPPDAIPARLGGDEFAILLPSIDHAAELLECADRILKIRQTISRNGQTIECRASIGASIYPEHGLNPSELLRHADIALYAAKGSGRGKREIFETGMLHEVRERAAMVSRARTAAESGDILAFYQPKVDLRTGALMGFEALLRWRDSRGQIHAPGRIAAAFDDPEVANLLGQEMLEHVLADLAGWTGSGLAYGNVAINAAPAELRRTSFASRLVSALRGSGLPDGALTVEVTEGVFLGRGASEAKQAIHLLHDQGISIALDDFGTGFASLTHLRALPVDTLKIDRSFVTHVADEQGDKAIVSAIINLGRSLGMEVIAEGIETNAQAETLRSFGCEAAQGYLFGMPTPAAEIPALISNWPNPVSVAPRHGAPVRPTPANARLRG